MKELNLDSRLPYQSLHGHTTHSDGEMTYKQVLDECEKARVGVYAFTDHDFVPDNKLYQEIKELDDHNVKYIVGTELSCSPPWDSHSTKGIHIAGLFIDPFDQKLRKSLDTQRAERKEQFLKTIENFKRSGFIIDRSAFEESLEKDTLTAPVVKELVFADERNIERMETMFEDFRNQNDLNDMELNALKIIHQHRDKPTYLEKIFYELFLYHQSRLNQEPPRGRRPRVKENVDLIRNAGGTAVFAHYTFGGKELGEKYFRKMLENNEVDGVEVVYGKGEQDYTNDVLNDMKLMDSLADEYDLIKSGGADIHSLLDLKFFTGTKDLAERTTNLLQNMLQKVKVNTEWSSICKWSPTG